MRHAAQVFRAASIVLKRKGNSVRLEINDKKMDRILQGVFHDQTNGVFNEEHFIDNVYDDVSSSSHKLPFTIVENSNVITITYPNGHNETWSYTASEWRD
jgi:predicted SAM-dependent methyltransferase